MTGRVRRCRACGALLTAGASCAPCEATVVHVVTTLGALPPPWPGRRRAAVIGHRWHPGTFERMHSGPVTGVRPNFTVMDEPDGMLRRPASPNAGPHPGVEWV